MLVVRVKSPDGQMTYEGALLNLEKQYVLRSRNLLFNLVFLVPVMKLVSIIGFVVGILKMYFCHSSSSNSSPFCVVENERFRSRLKSDNPRDYELESFPTAAQVLNCT